MTKELENQSGLAHFKVIAVLLTFCEHLELMRVDCILTFRKPANDLSS